MVDQRIVISVLLFMLIYVAPVQSQEHVFFSDDFDSGQSAAHWVELGHSDDYSIDYAFDYSVRGIPSAPGSVGGSRVGMQVMVNNTDTVPGVEAVSLYPVVTVPAGDYSVRFDMWIHYNGGAGGGSGSTEFATFGIGHAGDRVVWANNASSDGRWFAVTGEGGAGEDYRAYRNATFLSADEAGMAEVNLDHSDPYWQELFPSPPYETQGAPGKQWVEVEILRRNGVLEWRLNDRVIAIDQDDTNGVGTVMIGCMDTYSSIANPVEDNFVLYDNFQIVVPDCNQNGQSDDVDVMSSSSTDCNGTGVPDECEFPSLGGTGFPYSLGDMDVDGDVDLEDYRYFADCLNGPTGFAWQVDPSCVPICIAAFDSNADSRIDLRDYAQFQTVFTVGQIPPRPKGAPTGSQFIAETAGISRVDREARVLEEISSGNVPGYLRQWVPVNVSATINHAVVHGTFYVLPDYLAIGTNEDFLLMPMSPLVAQPIADAWGCLLPTRKMVDAIYSQASLKIAPQPISPAYVDIMRPTTFYRHERILKDQRSGQSLNQLIGGHKKDVVITPQLPSRPDKVAIYGWHQLNGQPIQPLYLGHVDWYHDYSHGLRFVNGMMEVNGEPMTVEAVLADPTLCVLLSDEGVITNPRYPYP